LLLPRHRSLVSFLFECRKQIVFCITIHAAVLFIASVADDSLLCLQMTVSFVVKLTVDVDAFSALTLLVQQQEAHPACKN